MSDQLKIKESNRFLIIVTGFNCEQYVTRCYESLCKQSREWVAVFVDDESTDHTWDKIDMITDPRVTKIRNQRNIGAAANRIMASKCGMDNDIIVLVGMDDYLLPDALARIDSEYQKGKIVTYGNWTDQMKRGLPRNFNLDFDSQTHRDRNYRKVSYRSTAPNTMRKWLFDLVPEDDFKMDGEWIKATTESHLMFSCMEMAGKDRIGVIRDKIYFYQKGRPDHARNRFGSQYQDRCYAHVISLPKKELLP